MSTYDISGGTANIDLSINEIRENVLISIQTDATYNGTTDTLTFQQSIDGVNWHGLEEEIGGTAIVVTLTAINLNLFELSRVYYGRELRAVFTAVNGTVGIVTINTSLKN